MKSILCIFLAVLLCCGTAQGISRGDITDAKVDVIDERLNHYDQVLGLAASPSGETHRADHETLTPFQSDAGNDQFGSWLQILGSSDTPHLTSKTFFSLSNILVSDVEATASKVVHLVQIGFGATGAAAVSAENVSEIVFSPEKDGKEDMIYYDAKRHPSGTKVWLRHWVDGINTATMDFFIVIREYDE